MFTKRQRAFTKLQEVDRCIFRPVFNVVVKLSFGVLLCCRIFFLRDLFVIYNDTNRHILDTGIHIYKFIHAS